MPFWGWSTRVDHSTGWPSFIPAWSFSWSAYLTTGRRFTRSGIAPDRPIAILLSSIRDKRSSVQAALPLDVGFPILRALTRGLMTLDEAMSSSFFVAEGEV
ncbi:hypothetical protein U1Q18_027571 [Sarracenia purpurea var. burkii]